MKSRCYNAKQPNYRKYGARGIKVCERWLESFDNFFADMGSCPPGHTLDRIDNNGHYAPENCRWATPREQTSHTRRNHKITFNGETMNLADWARRLGVGHGVILTRLNVHGWSLERALTTRGRTTR